MSKSKFIKAYENGLKGLTAVSTGLCPNCSECAEQHGYEDMAKFNDFYTNTHIREVVAMNPRFIRATRYEKLEGDPRNDHGPRWLAMYEMEDQAAADTYIQRDSGPREGRPNYTPGLNIGRQPPEGRWRMIWRRHAPADGEIGGGGAECLDRARRIPDHEAGKRAVDGAEDRVRVGSLERLQRQAFGGDLHSTQILGRPATHGDTIAARHGHVGL